MNYTGCKSPLPTGRSSLLETHDLADGVTNHSDIRVPSRSYRKSSRQIKFPGHIPLTAKEAQTHHVGAVVDDPVVSVLVGTVRPVNGARWRVVPVHLGVVHRVLDPADAPAPKGDVEVRVAGRRHVVFAFISKVH